jgi:hypothetical protein
VNNVFSTAFVSEVVTVVFRRREIQLNGEGKPALLSSSSLTNHLVRLFSCTFLGLVSPTTLFFFRCDTSHTCDCPKCPIW